MKKRTQKAPKGEEIPIPKRGDFFRNLKKAVSPAPTEGASPLVNSPRRGRTPFEFPGRGFGTAM